MKKFKIELLQTANDEIEEIFNYIYLDSPQNAGKMIDKIFFRFHQLEDFPESGIKLTDKILIKYGFRMLIEDPYIIFYNLDKSCQKIYIHHILHSARNWISILQD